MTENLSAVESTGLAGNQSHGSACPHIVDATQESALEEAALAIKAGDCIVVPTDTVYGIAADVFSQVAVQRLLAAKRRGPDLPPPVLIAEPGMLRALTTGAPKAASDLAKEFWPGPLTLILKSQRSMKLEIGETDGTVAIRVPDHDLTRELLRRTGPLAVSSANISGEPAARSAAEAARQLGDAVGVYLDAGQAPGGVASTIIDFTADEDGRIVREGAISLHSLLEIAPKLKPFRKLDEKAAAAIPEPESSETESEPSELKPVSAELEEN